MLRRHSDLGDADQNGIKIVLGSCRMPAGVELIENKLGISCIKICNAGTYILVKENCIDSKYLSLDSMRSIYKEVAEKKFRHISNRGTQPLGKSCRKPRECRRITHSTDNEEGKVSREGCLDR